MDKLDQINSILSLLITPGNVKQPDLDRSLRENVLATFDVLDSPDLLWLKHSIKDIKLDGPINDNCWDFTSVCLRTLICLCDILIASRNNPTPTADVIGARQQTEIRSALQLVTSLGIARNLMPGVGVPLNRRSQFCNFMESTSCPLIVANNTDHEKHCMLYSTVRSLHSCCRNSTLASLILINHLNDLLAALCQLCFSPLKKSKPPELDNTNFPGKTSEMMCDNVEQHQLLHFQILQAEKDRTQCLHILKDILTRTFRPKIVQELLRLQGARKTSECMALAPNWLRKATQKLLNEIILSKHGLLAVIQGIVDNGESQSSEWQTCNVIAKVISSLLISSKPDCQANISEQLIELLTMDQTPVQKHLPMVVSSAISLTALRRLEIAQRYILEPLLRPLILCAEGKVYSRNIARELTECILNLHKIFVVGNNPNDEIINQLAPAFGLIFHIYEFLLQTVSGLRMPVEELIGAYLKSVEASSAVDQLYEIIFASAEGKQSLSALIWNPQLELVLDDEAGLTVSEIEENVRSALNWLETDGRLASSILAMLSYLHSDEINGKLFLRLLQDLSSLVGSDLTSSASRSEIPDRKYELIQIENAGRLKEIRIRRSLLTINLLSSFCENAALQDSIIKDNKQIFQFLNATLERGAILCSSKSEDVELMEAETLTMAMGIMTLMLSAVSARYTNNSKLASVSIPHLQTLKSKHSSEGVRRMAEELLIAIVANTSIPRTTVGQKNMERKAMSKFEEAWEDVFDPEIPVRGHALLALTKLISAKDKETIDHSEEILLAFQKNLKHVDSYVYLMAVQGLVALCNTFTDKVVPILTDEFSNMGANQFDTETRMKLGEVLVKATRNLGEMVPKYRDRLLNAFLLTCRDEDPLVRSSSLSNLGEACKELKYALGSNIYEIFNCLSSYAKCDSSVHVRRAAVQVIVLLLRGLGKDALIALDNIMKDLYGLIKHVIHVDKDDVVKLHAQLALEELELICRDFLFPKVALEKRITIVGP